MKKLKTKVIMSEPSIVEEEGGLITLLGKNVIIQCMNYNYTGTLVGVNTTCVELDNAKVVFETGPYTSQNMKLAEEVHKKQAFVMVSSIESFWEI